MPAALIAPIAAAGIGMIAGNNQNKANIAAQQGAQQQGQQFSVQQQQAAYAHDDAMKQAAMQALTGFQQAHPNPVNSYRPLSGPQQLAPQAIGGGMLGQGGQMLQQGLSGAAQQPPQPGFDPSIYMGLLQKMLPFMQQLATQHAAASGVPAPPVAPPAQSKAPVLDGAGEPINTQPVRGWGFNGGERL